MQGLKNVCMLVVLYTNLYTFILCIEDDNGGSNNSWSYIPGQNDPSQWPSVFDTCAGDRQSPIDIPITNAKYDDNLNDISLIVIKDSDNMTLGNNGHFVYLTSDGIFHIEGGGLSDIYQVLGPHFHWGSESTKGSEHTLDGGNAYPLEMHIVTFDVEKYSDATEAIESGDGNALAVFGVLFTIGEEDNPRFQPIIDNLLLVEEKGATVLVENLRLEDLLPESTSIYYRYMGSLTTPKCDEIVIWTLFEQKVQISEKQLQEFRKIKDNDGNPMVDNFRPPQELRSREILKSFQAPAYNLEEKPANNVKAPSIASENKGYCVIILMCIVTVINMYY